MKITRTRTKEAAAPNKKLIIFFVFLKLYLSSEKKFQIKNPTFDWIFLVGQTSFF
jgi:hypothetical protein